MSTKDLSLEELAQKVAHASRIKDVSVELVQGGKAAVIVLDGRKLAYVRTSRKGISVELTHYGRYERGVYEDVRAADAAVRTSERRKPKQRAEKPAEKPAGVSTPVAAET